MSKKELGFNMDQILIIKPAILVSWDSTFIDRINYFKEELKALPGVKGVATSGQVPGGGELFRTFDVTRLGAGDAERYTMRLNRVDYDFMNVYGIKVLAGRNFTPADHNPDFGKLTNTIINQSAAKLLGFKSPEDAIGKSIMRGGPKKWDVIGVVADYHHKSLRHPLEPILFMPVYTSGSTSVKVTASDLTAIVASLKQKFETFYPGNVFDYYFLDDRFNEQYSNEQLFEKVFGIFTAFAIFVACLGLFGLTMFSSIQRTKEIGVRKVLGASVSNIIILLSKDFIKLVAIACLIAFPLAWWVMNNWLQDFSYRTQINGWVFLLAGLVAVMIALITVSFQAVKAAIKNPVKSLRTE